MPGKAASKRSPSIQALLLLSSFAHHSVGSTLQLAPLFILRCWSCLLGLIFPHLRPLGKSGYLWLMMPSKRLNFFPLGRLRSHAYYWTNHWPGEECTRSPGGHNLPRSTLMLKWEVRAVGRGNQETDGETIINVPKDTSKGKKLWICWYLQMHHLKMVMLLLPQNSRFLNSCQNLKKSKRVVFLEV